LPGWTRRGLLHPEAGGSFCAPGLVGRPGRVAAPSAGSVRAPARCRTRAA